MDNYSLEEVKMLIDKNMVTPEIFNNILTSTTRRLELYNDQDDLAILKYLSQSEVVPSNIKKDIDTYLMSYKEYNIKASKKIRKYASQRKKTVVAILLVIAVLIIFCIFLIIKMG